MKEINSVKINNVDYAVGLEWEELHLNSKKDFSAKLKETAKSKNKEFGCVIKKDNGSIQIGFAKPNNKGLISIAAILSKELNDTLFIKKINNTDNWICYIDSNGLIIDRKEGIFSDQVLFEMIDEIQLTGSISITCSKEDQDSLFSDGFEYATFTNIYIEDILERNKKTIDDTINLIVKKSNLKSKLITATIFVVFSGGASYYILTDSQEYKDIVNQELSSPLEMKESKFKKMIKENQEKLSLKLAENAGKKMLKEKIESNIYTKEEIHTYISSLYNLYPLYFYEWKLEGIQFIKSEDNKDIKFSVIYKRIDDSIGYYNEIKEKSIELAKKNLKLYDIIAYPGDLGNNIIIVDHYFKKPLEIKQGQSEQEQMAKLEKEIKDTEKQLVRIKDNISEIEYRVSNEISFFDRKFGSSVSEAAEEIETNVSKGIKLYDKVMETYQKQNQESITIPESYYASKKIEFINLSQQNSYYQWRDDKQPYLLPPAPSDKKKQENFKAFAKVWKFNINSQDYATRGISSIKRAVELLNKTDISIYNISYKVENESWFIRAELYEKN